MPYFTMDKIYEIHGSVIKFGLSGRRDDLLAGLSLAFIAELDEAGAPSEQLFKDLTELNVTDPLDEEIPFERWLRNAEFMVLQPARKAYFRDLADQVAARRTLSDPVQTLKEAIPERILFTSDMVGFGFLSGAMHVGQGTARLKVPLHEDGEPKMYLSGKPMEAFGTGWLISSRHVITNCHVIRARAKGAPKPEAKDIDLQARRATVLFDYDAEGLDGSVAAVGSLGAVDEKLDYAILELKEDSKRRPLPLWAGPLALPENGRLAVNIIQHPNGGVKQMAMRNNLAVLLNDRDLAYFTDTDGGSSGSAVCNDGWEVLALHKSSDPSLGTFEYQGKKTSWVNTGTRIDLIIDDLKQNHAECWAEIEKARKK
ncbi:endonuclease G [Bradyrhizobium sp. S3.2.6]